MAAVEMNRNQSNTSIFGKFMANLPLEKAQDVLHEGTFTKFSSRWYGVRIWNLAGLNYIQNETFHRSAHVAVHCNVSDRILHFVKVTFVIFRS